MPKPTEQVEGGSKVPWTTLTIRRAKGYENYNVLLAPAEFVQTPQEERETYIPVSALLSDEATEAVLASEEVANELRRVVRAHDEESLDEAAAYFLRAVFQAAIDHLGGTDAH